VVVLIKQNQRKMVEENEVETSLTDEEIREYLEEVIKEVKKAKTATLTASPCEEKYTNVKSRPTKRL